MLRLAMIVLAVAAAVVLTVHLLQLIQSVLNRSPQRVKRRFGVMLAALAVLAAAVFVLFFDMGSLPEGEMLASYPSPTGVYRMDMYLCNGGATTDYALRGAVVDTRTGRATNVYWQYHQSDAEVVWVDEETIQISGSVLGEERDVVLNVTRDKYDYRNAR